MERRFYQRAVVGLTSNFIVVKNEPGQREFNGRIEDLSECGIRISVEEDSYNDIVSNIAIGDKILFQSFDAYTLYDVKRTDVFKGESEVVRVEIKDGKVIIGCKMDQLSPDLSEYIKNKKLSLFFENGCKSDSFY